MSRSVRDTPRPARETNDRITCDAGCGRTLTLPTSKAAAEGWRRLSLNVDGQLLFRYVCPHCPENATDLERRAHGHR